MAGYNIDVADGPWAAAGGHTFGSSVGGLQSEIVWNDPSQPRLVLYKLVCGANGPEYKCAGEIVCDGCTEEVSK
jgi:hypothetical protein